MPFVKSWEEQHQEEPWSQEQSPWLHQDRLRRTERVCQPKKGCREGIPEPTLHTDPRNYTCSSHSCTACLCGAAGWIFSWTQSQFWLNKLCGAPCEALGRAGMEWGWFILFLLLLLLLLLLILIFFIYYYYLVTQMHKTLGVSKEWAASPDYPSLSW